METFIAELDYEQLVENSLTPKIIINETFKVLYVNKAVVELLSLSDRQDIFKMDFDSFIHPDFRSIIKERISNVIINREIEPLMEKKMVTLGGRIIDVEIMAVPYIHHNSTMAHLLIRDITERKEIQKGVLQAEKLSLIGELASGIVHEIRNPLTSIKGFIQLLKDEFPKKEYADVVLKELGHIEEITNELLYLSKPNDKDHQPEEILSIIGESVKLLDTNAFQNNVSIYFEEASFEKTIVLGNRTKLKQVFLNLIKNAIEAIPGDGKIHIKVEKDANNIYIYPLKTMERVFQKITWLK